MKISTLLGYTGGFKEAVAEVRELEKAGLDTVWVPEAYAFDAPSAMGQGMGREAPDQAARLLSIHANCAAPDSAEARR